MRLLSLTIAFGALIFSARAETPEEHARKIVIPKLEIRDATVRETLEYLAARSAVWDSSGKGINIIFKAWAKDPPQGASNGVPPLPSAVSPKPTGAGLSVVQTAPPAIPRITLSQHDVPLDQALNAVAKQAHYALRWDPFAAAIVPIDRGHGGMPVARPKVLFDKGVNQQAVIDGINKVVLPKIDFQQAAVGEVLEFLQQRAQALDPHGAGMNLYRKLDWLGPPNPADANSTYCPPSLTFTGVDMPMYEILRYLMELRNLHLRIGGAPGAIYFAEKE